MTPKAKAKELFQRYFDLSKTMTVLQAKDAALIAVDELLKNGVLYSGTESLTVDCEPNQTFNYWNNVKEEIERL